MTDLTAITTPYGLLDDATREALKAHGGPWELYGEGGKWLPWPEPQWTLDCTYRVKPQPPKPREWWLVCGRIYRTRDEALRFVERNPGEEIIHVREVLP